MVRENDDYDGLIDQDLQTEDMEEFQESERVARWQMERYAQHREQW